MSAGLVVFIVLASLFIAGICYLGGLKLGIHLGREREKAEQEKKKMLLGR